MPHRYGKLTCHMGSHRESHLYPQPKQVLDLATSDPEGMQG